MSSPDEQLEELRGLASLAADNLLDPSSSKRLGQLFFEFDSSCMNGFLPSSWAMSKFSKSKQE